MLTIEQKRLRRGYVCASEIASIVGLDKYTPITKLFYNKRPDLLGIDADALDAADVSTPAMDAGNHLERFIIDKTFFASRCALTECQKWVVSPDGICAATLDALADRDTIIAGRTCRRTGAKPSKTITDWSRNS